MSGFVTKQIGEVAEIRRGASPRPIDDWMSERGIPWVKISDATKNDSRFIYSTEGFIRKEGKSKSVEVYPEDLIISNSATPGLPRIMKIHACIHDGWLLAENFKGVTRDYLFYQVKYMRKYLVNQGNGSIFTNLKTDILKEFPIQIPVDKNGNLDENAQSEIVSVLWNIEDKIENNTSICADLEAMAKLLYDYWFVQFDFPDENGKPYKSSGGKMVWNEELKREIPEGWENGIIADLGDVIGGATPSTQNSEYYVENGIGWITPNDLSNTNNKYIAHGERDITEKAVESCSTTVMPKGTVLMSSRAPIGYLAIASDELCTNQGFKSVVPHGYSSEYVFQTLYLMMPYIKNFGVGSTFAEVSKDELSNMKILLPNKSVEKRFAEKTSCIAKLRETLELENQQLTSLRDFLLPMLMNGQVKVANSI